MNTNEMVCKGSWVIGSACGQCPRCADGLRLATGKLLDTIAARLPNGNGLPLKRGDASDSVFREFLISRFERGDLAYKPPNSDPDFLPGPKPDGGPAFPRHELSQIDGTLYAQHGGMALRDWFAGQIIASMSWIAPTDEAMRKKVESAFKQADMMLTERAK